MPREETRNKCSQQDPDEDHTAAVSNILHRIFCCCSSTTSLVTDYSVSLSHKTELHPPNKFLSRATPVDYTPTGTAKDGQNCSITAKIAMASMALDVNPRQLPSKWVLQSLPSWPRQLMIHLISGLTAYHLSPFWWEQKTLAWKDFW